MMSNKLLLSEKPFWLTGFIGLISASSFFLGAGTLPAQDAPFDKQALQIRDSVTLKSGSRLFGKILSQGKDENNRKIIEFETDGKAILTLDVARLVSKSHTVDEIDDQYNRRLLTLTDTPESHWEICNWCEAQPAGTNRFKNQIRLHQERIMELDPNDTKVRNKDRLDFHKADGRWVPREQYYESLGYKKGGTSWTPVLQLAVDERVEQIKEIEGERKREFRKWKNAVGRGNTRVAVLEQQLFGFCDAYAIKILFKDAKDETNWKIQRMYIDAFGRVQAYAAMEALVYFSVNGLNESNADRALDLLRQEHYNPAQAVARLVGESTGLASKNNATLQRAAFVIGELGTDNAIIPLINKLITRHTIAPGAQSGRTQASFSNTGNLDGFSMGGDTEPKIVDRKNTQVLNALKKITGQGPQNSFSKSDWESWYIQNYTLYDLDIRGRR